MAKKRLDSFGVPIKKNSIVENWQGRRAIADEKLDTLDENGEPLKTPVKVIGDSKENPGLIPTPWPLKRPAWYKRTK